MDSYFCGFYRIAGLETSPTIERLTTLPGFGCSVPQITGNLMLMPIAYGHQIVTLDAGSDRTGVSLENVAWPNGVKGKVMAHWAVFIP